MTIIKVPEVSPIYRTAVYYREQETPTSRGGENVSGSSKRCRCRTKV